MLQKSTINPRFIEWNILCGTEIRNVGSGADFREDVQPKRQINCPSPTCNSREVLKTGKHGRVTGAEQFSNPAPQILEVPQVVHKASE